MSIIKDPLLIRGLFKGVLRGPDGRVKHVVDEENLIVAAGRDAIAEQLLNQPGIAVPSHIGIGTGGTAPTLGDTELESEQGTRQSVSKDRVLNEIEFSAVFGPNQPVSSTLEIREAGIFNAASGGLMWARITFGVVTKEPEDTFDITWTWVVGQPE